MGVEPDQIPETGAPRVDPSTDQIPVQRNPYPTAQHPLAAPPPPRSRRAIWIVGAVVILAIAGTATAFAVSGGAKPAAVALPAVTPTQKPITTTVPQSPGQRFVADVLDTPGLSTDMSTSDLIGLGERICDAIGTPGITRANLVGAIATTKFGPTVAEVLVDAAARSYCPEKTFSSAPAAVLPPSMGGDGFSPGTYEVGTGTGQMPPGKYRSTGPDGGSSVCYYARLRNNDGGLSDIIDNDVSNGQSLLTVKPSDGYVKISGCTFTKAS